MAKRVTIMIDEAVDKKVRLTQALRIKETNGSYSFSRVISDIMKEHYVIKK